MTFVALILIFLAILSCRVVGVNPLNSALATLEYSTNGSSYTPFGTEVISADPGDDASKVIPRRLLGTTRVQKYVGRIDFGDGTMELEYSSATYALVLGWRDNKTLIWIRETSADTGGTNGSRQIMNGYVANLHPPMAKGDDETQTFTFKVATDLATFAAAV